jgi:lysophospholipase L1-like esterase
MRDRLIGWIGNGLLVLGSVAISVLAIETFLRAEGVWWRYATPAVVAAPVVSPLSTERDQIPAEVVAKAQRRRPNPVSMPEEWKLIDTEVPGAQRAYYWHGSLHVLNRDGFRRSAPFPEKRAGVYRVMVVGDSITYGYGLAEEDTYVALLSAWIGRDYKIEFINLGVSGYQSEDILNVIKRFLPELKPDLVIYGVCHNDFLPSGRGQYEVLYEFPLPDGVKRFFIKHTRIGALIDEGYDAMLRSFRLRRDFFDDILRDFEGYQKRFQRDVVEMNSLIREAGLPAIIGLVVDQYPDNGGRGYRITRAAETFLREAGAEVIALEEYYRRFHGKVMAVSQWEGHPDEVANYIWARMIAENLRQRADIRAHAR